MTANYFQAAVMRVLDAVDVASGGTAAILSNELDAAVEKGESLDVGQLEKYLRIYRQGHQDALRAVAIAFGLIPRGYARNRGDDLDRLPLIDKFRLPSWEG
jgi:hypothetical protein